MGYALIWILTLITSLFWVASIASIAAQSKARWVARLPVTIAAGVPFVLLLTITCSCAGLKYVVRLDHNWFGYSLSLLLAYLVGIVPLMLLARRSAASDIERAAQWPKARLGIA